MCFYHLSNRVAMCCSVLQWLAVAWLVSHIAPRHALLQDVAVCCRVLPCEAPQSISSCSLPTISPLRYVQVVYRTVVPCVACICIRQCVACICSMYMYLTVCCMYMYQTVCCMYMDQTVCCMYMHSQLQIGWHSILRLFPETFNLVPGVPEFSWDSSFITRY